MCFESAKWRGYELVTYRSTEFSAICVNINNSLSTSFAGTKVQIIVERKKLFAENLQKIYGRVSVATSGNGYPSSFLLFSRLNCLLIVDTTVDCTILRRSLSFLTENDSSSSKCLIAVFII